MSKHSLKEQITFFTDRIRRRIRENIHTLSHPDPVARAETNIRLLAYMSVLDDAVSIFGKEATLSELPDEPYERREDS